MFFKSISYLLQDSNRRLFWMTASQIKLYFTCSTPDAVLEQNMGNWGQCPLKPRCQVGWSMGRGVSPRWLGGHCGSILECFESHRTLLFAPAAVSDKLSVENYYLSLSCASRDIGGSVNEHVVYTVTDSGVLVNYQVLVADKWTFCCKYSVVVVLASWLQLNC